MFGLRCFLGLPRFLGCLDLSNGQSALQLLDEPGYMTYHQRLYAASLRGLGSHSIEEGSVRHSFKVKWVSTCLESII